MVCYDRTILENLESEGANNPNIEKISFKVVQIKLLVLKYFTVGNLQNILMEHDLYLIC